jgi:hypothetical protein
MTTPNYLEWDELKKRPVYSTYILLATSSLASAENLHSPTLLLEVLLIFNNNNDS